MRHRLESPFLHLALFAILAAAVLSAGPRADTFAGTLSPGGIQAAGGSVITVANLDPAQEATLVVDFYRQPDGAKTQLWGLAPAPLDGGTELVLSQVSVLQHAAFAAITSSDRRIASQARTVWPESGGATAYEQSLPGTEVIVPVVVKDRLAESSLVTVQNTDPSSSASVAVDIFASGSADPATTLSLELPPGTSQTMDVLQDVAKFGALPPGFLGWMRLTADAPIAANSIVDVASSRAAVYSFEGLPSDDAASELFVPRVRRGLDGSTTLYVLNPGEQATVLHERYTGWSGTCAGQTLTATHTVGAASVLELDAAAAPPDMPLPDDCMAAAVLESDVPIMAVVVERTTGQASTAAACLASAPEESARRVVVPSARKAADGWFTALLAMNVGPASATAMVSLRDRDGNAIPCADDCTGVIEPYSSHQWRLADIDAIPDGTNASAVITSDEPMVVVVQDEAAENDTTLLRGAAADPPAASDVPQPIPALSHLPLLLNEVTRPTVPDTATPTPTGATPASPTSPPVVSPTPECTTHTTHMTLGASATEIAVGEAVTVTARLTNDGCAPVGLLAYHLRDYASGGPQAVLEPLSPITVSHPIELASGMTDEAVFVLGAVSAGTADLSAAVSFEVHLGDPGRAYWAGDGAGPVSVAVVDRSKRVYVPIVLRDHAF